MSNVIVAALFLAAVFFFLPVVAVIPDFRTARVLIFLLAP